jgi:hypothetical protein
LAPHDPEGRHGQHGIHLGCKSFAQRDALVHPPNLSWRYGHGSHRVFVHLSTLVQEPILMTCAPPPAWHRISAGTLRPKLHSQAMTWLF